VCGRSRPGRQRSEIERGEKLNKQHNKMPFWEKKPTAAEAAKAAKRSTKREVRGAQRDMDREIRELDRTEAQVLAEIKKRAKAPGVSGNDRALSALAKQLVQIRKQKEKMFSTKANLGAVGMQATAMASQVAAASAVGNVTKAMGTANASIDAAAVGKIMTEFQRQNEIMGVREELMDDALTDAFDADEVEEEAEAVTNQVLAELGVELDSKMVGLDAPKQKPVGEEMNAEEKEALYDALPDLRARLDAL